MRPRSLFLASLLAAATSACQNDTGGIVNAPGCSDAESISAAAGAVSAGGGTPVTADELIAAMGGPSPATAPVFLGNGYAAAVFPGLGGLDATQGSNFAWISTGIAGAGTTSAVVDPATAPETGTNLGGVDCAGAGSYDCVQLTYSFVVPSDHHTVRFDFNFLSTEFPEFTGNIYNDRFTVSLASTTFNFPNISFDEEGDQISINNALFTDDDCEDFEGTGFDIDTGFGSCDAGATGLLGTIAPVAPGETVTLTFTLAEEGDAIYDSAVLIDNVQTTEATIDDPVTSDCD